ncbi:MAG: HD-GYP domain-containing protein [Acidobacteriota bacterium]
MEQDAPQILVVDDDAQVQRLLLQTLSRHGFECVAASDAASARDLLARQEFDLALCDVRMPGESGIALAKYIREKYPRTAVIVLTAVDDWEIADDVLESGVYGFLLKPFHTSDLIINVRNAVRMRRLEDANRRYREHLEQLVEERTIRLKKALDGIVQVVTRMVEARDPYTAGHQQRVAGLAVSIGKELGLSQDQLEGLSVGGMIHDLGKVCVPAEILSRPGALSPVEFSLIQMHCEQGFRIIGDIEFPWPVGRMVLEHHEKWNGRGYPKGLSGEQILLEARILCVADVVEAISSHRPYRPGLGLDSAISEIASNRGVLYDPAVVDAFMKLVQAGAVDLKASPRWDQTRA